MPIQKHVSQAQRVLAFFGGAHRLAQLHMDVVGRPRSVVSIYRWTYPKERRGTGGLIPVQVWSDLFSIAEAEGKEISAELLDPRPRPISADEEDIFL